MKIYLAAPYANMALMREWSDILEDRGHTVTARWIRGGEEQSGMTDHDKAQMDFDDVDAADALVSQVFPRGTPNIGGGRHVELGYAMARRKIMLNVGDGSGDHVFHGHHSIVTVPTIEAAADYLDTRHAPTPAVPSEAAPADRADQGADSHGSDPVDGGGNDPARIADAVYSPVRTIKYSVEEGTGNIIVDQSKPPFDGKPVLIKTPEGWAQAEWVKPTGFDDQREGFYWDVLDDSSQVEYDVPKLWAPLPDADRPQTVGEEAYIQATRGIHSDVLKDPDLLGFLYDADMLPEQCVSFMGATHLAAVCVLWAKLKEMREKYEAVSGFRIEPHTGMIVWARAMQDAKEGDLIKVSFERMEPKTPTKVLEELNNHLKDTYHG